MDVKLNNRNALHIALDNEVFKDVEWLVEANSNERHQLWRDYHEKFKWEQINSGFHCTILEIETKAKRVRQDANRYSKEKPADKPAKQILPVVVEFMFVLINGHKVCFYNTTSRLAHSGYVEAFLITNFQRTHDGYTRWNQVDANNFHNCINYLDTIDEKPRNTKYKVSDSEKEYHIFESHF